MRPSVLLERVFGLASRSRFAPSSIFSPQSSASSSTPEWHGDRFPDGRSECSRTLQLARLKDVTADEAWDLLQDARFRNQFEGGWTGGQSRSAT